MTPTQCLADKAGREARLNAARELILAALTACADCGLDDVVVLEFDHVRGNKVGNIATLVRSASLERLQEEISKCEVVCRNCHARREAYRQGYWKAKI